MPVSPPKPCSAPGCRELVRGRALCLKHDAERHRTRDKKQPGVRYAERGSRHERGYTNEWAAASKAYLAANPLCRACTERGHTTAARVTDHVTPHKGDPVLFWDVTNWQPLCVLCHDAKTAREDGPAHVRPNWLKTPGAEIILVAGPPGSGKSTLVRERAGPADVVIDLDEIVSELSGLPLYQAGRDWLARGIRERNRRLGALASLPRTRRAFVIISDAAPTRAWWIEKLKPVETIVLDTPEHVCAHRIVTDTRRQKVAARQVEVVRRWWLRERSREPTDAHGREGEGGFESLGSW